MTMFGYFLVEIWNSMKFHDEVINAINSGSRFRNFLKIYVLSYALRGQWKTITQILLKIWMMFDKQPIVTLKSVFKIMVLTTIPLSMKLFFERMQTTRH